MGDLVIGAMVRRSGCRRGPRPSNRRGLTLQKGSSLAKLIPAFVVSGVLLAAFLAPVSAGRLPLTAGYGQAVNGGGLLTSAPDAGAFWPALTPEDIFVRGTDNGVWHDGWNGVTFSGWIPGGGFLTANPGAAGVAANNTKVFVRGTDNGLWESTWNGSAFSSWTTLGGFLTSGVDAANQASGQVDVFVRGTDNGLWWRESVDGGATWPTGWISLGGILTSDPSAVSWAAGRLDVFARGTDNGIWIRSFNGSTWNAWAPLGGPGPSGIATSGPDAASCASGHLDVFARGTDNGYWQLGFSGSTWTGWKSEGNAWTSDPSAVCRPGTSIIDIFGRGMTNGLFTFSEPATP